MDNFVTGLLAEGLDSALTMGILGFNRSLRRLPEHPANCLALSRFGFGSPLKLIESHCLRVLSCDQRGSMQSHFSNALQSMPATKRWSRSRARCICPRRHLRVLPTRTRPSLFGGD